MCCGLLDRNPAEGWVVGEGGARSRLDLIVRRPRGVDKERDGGVLQGFGFLLCHPPVSG